MTPLQESIRLTVHKLESKIDECNEILAKIRKFCKHESCFVDMRITYGTFLPCRICVACDVEAGVPTDQESHRCITDYYNASRGRKNLQ